MDKYEYKQKTEQMLELMEDGAYRKAAEIADSIDWRRVRNASMLTNVSDIYEKNKEYEKSYSVLNLAYHRAEGSRKIISKLCTLALKTGNVDEAIDFYDDFMQIAPKDPNQYILKYQILRAQRAPIEQQIDALEEYKKSEYIEEWAYELAKLYQEAGMTAECLEECDDLILWFSEGKYVYKAMELKMQYKPLTPSQQEKYDKRFEKLTAETEEMPDIAAYAGREDDEEAADSVEEVQAEQEQVAAADSDDSDSPEENIEVSNNVQDTPDDESSVSETEIESDVSRPADNTLENKGSEKKKKLGNTMPLDEALRQLLHPENKETQETDEAEEEPALDDLEQAIDEIEAVVDVDMVKEITEKKKMASSAGNMTEIIPEDDDQIDGQLNLEDILQDWEGEPDSVSDEPELDDLLEIEEGEEMLDLEEELLSPEEGEVVAEEEAVELPVEESEDTEEELTLDDAEEASEELFADESEDIVEDDDPTEALEEETDINMTDGERQGETMEEKKTKKTEPILPPDIQRMIDEIEGVIPPQEETEKAPVKRTLERKEEPRENMGKVADSLRIDSDDFEEDYDFDEEDDFEEDFEELEDSEEFEDVEESDEEYLDEEEEELPDEEEYFEEDGEELPDEEEYFEEEEEELPDEEEYFEEEEEELPDEEEYFEEEEEEFPDEEEYFEEEEEEFPDEEEYFEEEEEELPDEEEYFEEDEEELPEDDEYFEEDAEELSDEEDEYGEGAIDFEEEFRVNPDHADELDDREIPDDDDDNMDILSATKPLSRKETAKLIATGKTAPLPLDEISDALSMTDTGFIVHGRYDLELQSGIGTRAGLTEEQKKLFSYFVPVRGMSEQLVDVLEQDKNCTNRQGTSRTGNLLIVGNKGNGKTVLAVDVVKAIQKQRNIRQGKVAIVTGDSLNKKKIGDIFDKLYGGALIIEKAGKMNERTVARLNKAMEKDTGELLIVLEEQRKPIDRLLSSNREFRRKFTSRLEVPIFINDELVTFGQTYAQENGYRIDEMGILALYSKIDSLQREDHAVTVAEVKEIMDSAIQHSQKASAKKLVKRVFGKNTDEADRILLSEKDFNI